MKWTERAYEDFISSLDKQHVSLSDMAEEEADMEAEMRAAKEAMLEEVYN